METSLQDFVHRNRFAVLAKMNDDVVSLERIRIPKTEEEKKTVRLAKRSRYRRNRRERERMENAVVTSSPLHEYPPIYVL